jgi:hypothetical protein
MTGILEFRVSSELIVESETLSPEEISARIGIPCDRCWRVGGLRGKTGKTWTTSGWVLKSSVSASSYTRSSLFSSCLGNLIKRLEPIADKIKNLCGEGDVGVSVDILASEIPGLYIDREVLRAIANVGAWLDIDITISEGTSGTERYRTKWGDPGQPS